ncbi:hypothetical protein DJ030_13185 [bacterium endosymbiont of Escarpia laminata]|nr:MAG: hypothetical protein DJ030_13185 [bacterium endosymbiont of Escarpia laminata]
MNSRNTMRYRYLPLLLLALPLLLNAKDRPFIDQPTDRPNLRAEEYVWEEGEVTLPKDLNEDQLTEFQVTDSSGRFRFFIDRSTLQPGEDNAIRVLLAIRSNRGALNTSYEGFHCGNRKYKVYAYGSHKGLKALKKPLWKKIVVSGSDNYRHTLYNQYLCDLNKGVPYEPNNIIHYMKQPTRVEQTPFFND